MLFFYHGTLSPVWQYMYILIEADRDAAMGYMYDKFRFDEDYISANFLVQPYPDLLSVSSMLQMSIVDLQNNKHTLIIDKNNFKDGCDCKKCKQYYPYSVPNQPDGSMVCYACRNPMF